MSRLTVCWPMIARLGHPVRFGTVGIVGVVVNTAILWCLVHLVRFPIPVASAVATEVAIVNNFVLNDRWTFRDCLRRHSLAQRFLRFNRVSLGGMAITVTPLILLTLYFGAPLLAANVVAVIGAMAWNYLMNKRMTW